MFRVSTFQNCTYKTFESQVNKNEEKFRLGNSSYQNLIRVNQLE